MTTTNQTPAQIVETLKVWNSNVAKTTVKLMNDYLVTVAPEVIEYKDFFIEKTTDLWALKNPKNVYSFSMKNGDKMQHAETIEECKEIIDEFFSMLNSVRVSGIIESDPD